MTACGASAAASPGGLRRTTNSRPVTCGRRRRQKRIAICSVARVLKNLEIIQCRIDGVTRRTRQASAGSLLRRAQMTAPLARMFRAAYITRCAPSKTAAAPYIAWAFEPHLSNIAAVA